MAEPATFRRVIMPYLKLVVISSDTIVMSRCAYFKTRGLTAMLPADGEEPLRVGGKETTRAQNKAWADHV